MKKNTLIFMAIFLATTLLLSACKDSEGTGATGEAVKVLDNENNNIRTVELRLDKEQGIFEPNTIEVEEGQEVIIQFMNKDENEEIYTFAILDYGIVEPAKANHVEFTADQKGTFIFECIDCKESASGLLKVR